MADPKTRAAADRVNLRVAELCDFDVMERTGLKDLARTVYLDALETNMQSVSVERLVAFAEIAASLDLIRTEHLHG